MLDPTKSVLQVKITGGLTIPLGGFQGQSNGQTEPAFLDLEAGQPDAEGFTRVNLVDASEFIFVDSSALAGFVICVKITAPVPSAGILGCSGGRDVGISLDQDHRLGQLGVDRFTTGQCEEQGGEIEIPYAACSAGTVGAGCDDNADCDTPVGANNGVCTHVPARCLSGRVGMPCSTNTDCMTEVNPGQCGLPHGGVCNGPLVPAFQTGDTGPGQLLIAPLPEEELNGMIVEISFESALPCGDEGPGFRTPFALTTGVSRSRVLNANNELGRTLTFETEGESFSCHQWQENTRGRLVLSAPALDQRLVGDVATVFVFASN